MSLTLGEKLQQAREARGITISEVAEQTRISALYLENIENNDYRNLPGGIFNKGFVKSYARYVGIDEQEALQDYSRLIVEQQGENADEPKTYKPQVLTDERASSSSLMTIIFAVVILGLMTWGILALVNYLQNDYSAPVANNNTSANTNANAANPAVTPTPVSAAPTLDATKIEFKASGDDVSLLAVNDGKRTTPLVSDGKTLTFEPKTSLKLAYSSARAKFAQLSINGKAITLPNASSKATVEFEINKDNLAQIWQSGQVTASAPANAPR